MRFVFRWPLAVLGALAFASAFAADTTPTRHGTDVDRDFGLEMPDPYRWMEGEKNAEFDTWLKARGAETRKHLDALPGLEDWRKRLAAAADATTSHSDRKIVAGKIFFLREEAGREGALMVRDTDGRERVVFDPNKESGTSITNYSVSPDAVLVTINLSRAGSEICEVQLRKVDTGEQLPDLIKPVWSEFNPSWLPDGSGFAYTRVTNSVAGDPLQGMASYLHRIGQAQAADRLIARADAAAPLKISSESFPNVVFVPGSNWAFLGVVGARPSERLCVAPAAEVMAGREKWRCLVDFADDVQFSAAIGDTLYLLVAGKTPNRHIVSLDLSKPDVMLADARPVVAQRDDLVLQQLWAAKDALYINAMRDGVSVVERMDYAGGAVQALTLPFAGTAELRADPDQSGVIVELTGWTVPAQAYRFDPVGNTLIDLKLGTTSPGDYSDIVAEQLQATSADGTSVPMTVIHRRDLPLDGKALTLLRGYGGYGISYTPDFSAMRLAWAKQGHVQAICHTRGGGEKGDAWRIGGTGANKQRGVEDFIACSKALAERGFSTAKRTFGWGASMGGALLGGAYTTDPDAFGGMVIFAGELNPVRLLVSQNGANQIAEMGDPRTSEGMRQLLAMDPYQHVQNGKQYPPLLLVVGLADQRVSPWISGKFAARVMAASPSTPVWIRTDDGLGHFPTNLSSAAIETADVYSAVEEFMRSNDPVSKTAKRKTKRDGGN
jgi:prolyl oligopeptidase